MVRYAAGHAEDTRKKIIKAASKLFRERGVKAASVPAIMESAGLTVGGFYRHFPSKKALFREALAHALDRTFSLMIQSEESMADESWLDTLGWVYLTPEHRDNRGRGCPIPALCGDLAREDLETRQIFEEQLASLVDRMAQHLSTVDGDERARCWRILAQLTGGLMLSRSVAGEAVSLEILEACRKGLR